MPNTAKCQYIPYYTELILREYSRKQKIIPRLSARVFADYLGIDQNVLSKLLSNSGTLSMRGFAQILEKLAPNLTDDEIARFIHSVSELHSHEVAQKLAAVARPV